MSREMIPNTVFIIVLLLLLQSYILPGKFMHGNKSTGSNCIWRSSPNNMQVFWINLDRNMDRRNFIETQFNRVQLRLHKRISAISPNSSEYLVDQLEQPCKRNTKKDISVILSHLKAIHSAVYHSIVSEDDPLSDFALIIEDDVKFLFDIDFAALIASAPKDFGILQLVTSNVEAIHSLLEQFKSSGGGVGGGLWRRTEWNHFTRNGKTSLYWSAQAYLVHRKNIRPFLDDVVSVDPATGLLHFRIVNSFFPQRCVRTRERPCVLANCLFADSYLFSGGGPTYVSTLPLFTGARVGLVSTLHQEQVGAHHEAFSLIHRIGGEVLRQLRNNTDMQLRNSSARLETFPGQRLPPVYLRAPVCVGNVSHGS